MTTQAPAPAYPFWDALGGTGRACILPCGKCGTAYSDPLVARLAHIHEALRSSAAIAGWDIDADGTWCCPGCLEVPGGAGGLDSSIVEGFAESIRRIYRQSDAAEQEAAAALNALETSVEADVDAMSAGLTGASGMPSPRARP